MSTPERSPVADILPCAGSWASVRIASAAEGCPLQALGDTRVGPEESESSVQPFNRSDR